MSSVDPTVGYRHYVMLLGLMGLAICYIMRISPGIIVISMTKPKVEVNESANE